MKYINKTLIFYKYLIIYNRGKNMKGLNKSIATYIVSAIFFTIIAVSLTVVLTMNLINNNIRKTYEDSGIIVDIEPKIAKRLEKLNDVNGLDIAKNRVNITNNSDTNKKYEILLTPLNNNEKDIRLSLNNLLIRNLDKFEKEDNNYVLFKGELKSGYSAIFQVGMWQSEESESKTITADFKLNVKIIDE